MGDVAILLFRRLRRPAWLLIVLAVFGAASVVRAAPVVAPGDPGEPLMDVLL